MPSKKGTSVTYPSEDGSDVDRSSGFWSLPNILSTPAASDQSVVTNDSRTDCEGLRVLVDYPSQSYHQRILEEFTEWYVEKLYPKLVATEAAWRDLEALVGKGEAEGQISYDALDARLDAIDAVMREHSLLLDVVEHPRMLPPSGGGGGPVRWTLHMDGDLLVGRGEAAHDGEVLCSALFARLRNEVLRHTPCYSGTWDD